MTSSMPTGAPSVKHYLPIIMRDWYEIMHNTIPATKGLARAHGDGQDKLHAKTAEYLAEPDLPAQQGENGMFHFAFQSPVTRMDFHVLATDAEHGVAIFTVPHVTVPPGKRTAMAEYLTRANCGMKLGSFKMDMQDGYVFFKVFMPIEDAQLSKILFYSVLKSSVVAVDRYYRGMQRVIYGDVEPLTVIQDIEAHD